jgi:hypothetical protein
MGEDRKVAVITGGSQERARRRGCRSLSRIGASFVSGEILQSAGHQPRRAAGRSETREAG